MSFGTNPLRPTELVERIPSARARVVDEFMFRENLNKLSQPTNTTANVTFRGELVYARFKVRNFFPTSPRHVGGGDTTRRRCGRRSLMCGLNYNIVINLPAREV